MNIYNSFTYSKTTVSEACYKCSDDLYITIPEQGRANSITNDNVNNYLPTRQDRGQFKKVLNTFEDVNDSDISTDIDESDSEGLIRRTHQRSDSENEITDLSEPYDALKNNSTSS